MNNITTGVCENWNNNNNINTNNNPSLVSFVGLQNNNYKQYWDWETNPNTNTPTATTTNINTVNNNPFLSSTSNNNFYDYTTLPSFSSSPNFNENFITSSQFTDYSTPAVEFLKKEADEFGIEGGSYYNNNGGRIGLNLGHRTYFSSRETALIDRLFRRPRGFYQANQVPRCQAEGCKIDLTNAKHYHRRHKVCEFHSKATKVVAGGIEQRFCQQCSRFHVLAEFDQAKRSCRKRLADHNRRRRKPQIGQPDSVPAATQTAENASSSSNSEQFKETSLSSSANLPLLISTFHNNNNITSTKPSSSSTTTFKTNTTTTANSPSAKSTTTANGGGTHFTTTNGPDLSLGSEDHHQIYHQRSYMFNHHHSSGLFHGEEATVAPYHGGGGGILSDGAGGNSSDNHNPDELQSLLQLRQNMFEVEML